MTYTFSEDSAYVFVQNVSVSELSMELGVALEDAHRIKTTSAIPEF
jgi:hypothetical protein